METAAVTSETSSRRPKQGRVSEEPEESPYRDSEDGSYEDEPDESEPRAKRKRAAAGAARVLDEGYSLIEVIRQHGKLMHHAVKQWVERYEKEPMPAMADLLMMLFEACGVRYQLDASSLEETNVDSVVLDLVNLATNGNVEDNYTSKSKEHKIFKQNLVTFWDDLVLECQNGPLFDKVLFEKCTNYIIAISCTPPRVYRQVASLVGLQLVTSFISVAKALSGQRETTQRQLNAEKKKRGDGPRIESLNKRLSLTHEKITEAEEIMRKIFTGLFMHRYRDVDPDIRASSIKALGHWIASYPSLFLQDSYLKYLGWTLNDGSAAVRKTSVLALQALYEVEDNVPSLGLFTDRFSNRMIELADDIDVSVGVAAIGLLKQLLRHQLLSDDELGPLYDLLIDEPPMIRRAIGELVYDHLIAQTVGSSQISRGEDEPSEVHLGRMLQILREFPNDLILISYVIDDVWDDMKAMKDWKCIISMLLDEIPSSELTDVDVTNLIRVFYTSAKKAVGEKIVPATDNRKQYYNKTQKEAFDNSKRDLTVAMLKNYPQLLRKYAADKAKIAPLVEIVLFMKLELYSLKRQEQNFKTIVELICDAFFKHSQKDALRSCMKALTFCSTESQADLQIFAENKLKELEDELISKLMHAMRDVVMGGDEYTLMVNLKRLYELQLTKPVENDSIFEDMSNIIKGLNDLDDEVLGFLLLNMYLHVAWCLHSIDRENPSEASVSALVTKRDTLLNRSEDLLKILTESRKEGQSGKILASRVCFIVAETWYLFKKSMYTSTKVEILGYYPNMTILQKFWELCQQQFNVSDDTEDEDENVEYIEEISREAVMIAAAKLVASDVVSKEYLGPEIISHFIMHGPEIAEIIKYLISSLRKTASNDIPGFFLEALKRAYMRHMVDLSKENHESAMNHLLLECKDLASRLSATFIGAARSKYKSQILEIVKDGISFAFLDAPKQLSFLEAAVLPFVSKLPPSDALDILKDVQKRSENINTDEDPSGWRPYHIFVEALRDKYAKSDGNQDDKDVHIPRRRGRPRKSVNVQGRKLFQEQSESDEDSISGSDQSDHADEDDEEEQPLIHTFRSASKLAKLQQLKKDKLGTKGAV